MVDLALNYAKVGKYERAFNIVKEMMEDDDRSPLQDLADLYSIKRVLNQRNVDQFVTAYEKVNRLLSGPFSVLFAIARIITNHTKIEITRNEICILKAILCINLGQFEEAYSIIDENSYLLSTSECDGWFFQAL